MVILTSNSLIWTSCGLMWLSWLKVFTATVSPLCLFTPWKEEAQHHVVFQMDGIERFLITLFAKWTVMEEFLITLWAWRPITLGEGPLSMW